MAAQEAPYEHLKPKDIDPQLIPGVDTDVFTQTVFLDQITLCLKAGETASVVVTVLDKQETPREVLVAEVDQNSPQVYNFAGRRCPSGLSWSAASADKVTGYVRGRS